MAREDGAGASREDVALVATRIALRVAVVIPNGNGRQHLEACIPALARQTYPDFETVVVDNASVDGSVGYVRENFPTVRVIELDYDGVFAGAVNAGIKATTSEIVVLLNNDTEPEPTWLAELIAALDRTPDASMAASKLLLWDRRDHLHSAGDFYGLDGVPGNRGVWQRDDGRYDEDRYVFGACGGAAAYRRTMLDAIGLFDETLVAYCEDVDLNLRAALAGYRCAFAPKARVYHRVSATGGGPKSSYWVGRNFIVVLAARVPWPIVGRFWDRMVAAQLAIALKSLWHVREGAARARLRGQVAGLFGIPRALALRRREPSPSAEAIARLEALMALGDRPTAGVVV